MVVTMPEAKCSENLLNVICNSSECFVPQVASAIAMPGDVISIRLCTKPVGGGAEECVRPACTTQQGPSVIAVSQATSQIPAAKWTALMPAYVSVSLAHYKHIH